MCKLHVASLVNPSLLQPSIRLTANSFFFFFNDTATTEIYTLSLHDALPIFRHQLLLAMRAALQLRNHPVRPSRPDRKSTRLNSSHSQISYAVFCLKKKKTTYQHASHPADSPDLRHHPLQRPDRTSRSDTDSS